MNITYTIAYKCDRCGKESEGGRWDWQAKSAPAPLGWLVRIELLRSNGIIIHDLCEDCSALPIRQVLEWAKSDA